jgi:hypothetical protein
MRAEDGLQRMIFREDGSRGRWPGSRRDRVRADLLQAAFVLVADGDGTPNGAGANFIGDERGRLVWLRLGGQLFRHEL